MRKRRTLDPRGLIARFPCVEIPRRYQRRVLGTALCGRLDLPEDVPFTGGLTPPERKGAVWRLSLLHYLHSFPVTTSKTCGRLCNSSSGGKCALFAIFNVLPETDIGLASV